MLSLLDLDGNLLINEDTSFKTLANNTEKIYQIIILNRVFVSLLEDRDNIGLFPCNRK